MKNIFVLLFVSMTQVVYSQALESQHRLVFERGLNSDTVYVLSEHYDYTLSTDQAGHTHKDSVGYKILEGTLVIPEGFAQYCIDSLSSSIPKDHRPFEYNNLKIEEKLNYSNLWRRRGEKIISFDYTYQRFRGKDMFMFYYNKSKSFSISVSKTGVVEMSNLELETQRKWRFVILNTLLLLAYILSLKSFLKEAKIDFFSETQKGNNNKNLLNGLLLFFVFSFLFSAFFCLFNGFLSGGPQSDDFVFLDPEGLSLTLLFCILTALLVTISWLFFEARRQK
jgi:hypothetical protein